MAVTVAAMAFCAEESEYQRVLGGWLHQPNQRRRALQNPLPENVLGRWLHQQSPCQRDLQQTWRKESVRGRGLRRQVSCCQLQHQCAVRRRVLCVARRERWILHYPGLRQPALCRNTRLHHTWCCQSSLLSRRLQQHRQYARALHEAQRRRKHTYYCLNSSIDPHYFSVLIFLNGRILQYSSKQATHDVSRRCVSIQICIWFPIFLAAFDVLLTFHLCDPGTKLDGPLGQCRASSQPKHARNIAQDELFAVPDGFNIAGTEGGHWQSADRTRTSQHTERACQHVRQTLEGCPTEPHADQEGAPPR